MQTRAINWKKPITAYHWLTHYQDSNTIFRTGILTFLNLYKMIKHLYTLFKQKYCNKALQMFLLQKILNKM